jgi:hypothetical protein
MGFIRLSEALSVNASQVLYSREDGKGIVSLTFAGPGPSSRHELELQGDEAKAWRDFLTSGAQ